MYVVGYPKSGNTWLCFLLAYCLNAEYDDLDDPGVHPTNEYQRRYVKGGLSHTSHQERVGMVLKTHALESPELSKEEPVVYLIRDGRDVMVSYYFYRHTYINSRNAHPVRKTLLKLRNLLNSNSDSAADSGDFPTFLRHYTGRWVNHVATWLDRQPTAIIRYEDLKTNPESSLQELFSQLDVKVDPEIIQQALAIFDFKKLSQRKQGEEDRTSFFRKGIVGDWQNHFSAEDLNFFQTKAGKVMNKTGYKTIK